jgi:RecB family endonuclease NucS
MSKQIIESLFYQFYNAILLGSPDIQIFYEILQDEYNHDEKQFDFLQDNGCWEILVKLIEVVKNKLTVKNLNFDNKIILSPQEAEEKSSVDYEYELIKIILQSKDSLANILGATKQFYFYNFEHPTLFGKVDLVAQDGMTMYLIETKRDEAKHDVVSQIDKYILDFKLKLNLKLWNNVIGVVIANGFPQYVLQELVKNGIIPLRYSLKDGIFKLSKVRSMKNYESNSLQY